MTVIEDWFGTKMSIDFFELGIWVVKTLVGYRERDIYQMPIFVAVYVGLSENRVPSILTDYKLFSLFSFLGHTSFLYVNVLPSPTSYNIETLLCWCFSMFPLYQKLFIHQSPYICIYMYIYIFIYSRLCIHIPSISALSWTHPDAEAPRSFRTGAESGWCLPWPGGWAFTLWRNHGETPGKSTNRGFSTSNS